MTNNPLTKELISDPRICRLAIELQPNALEIVIHSTIEDSTFLHRRIFLSKAEGDQLLHQLEDAIYDNPLLLSDFNKVDFVISNKRFTVIPDSITDDDMREEIMSVLWPERGYSIVDNRLSSSGSTLLMGVDTPLLAFIRRTFPMARISHQLTPIIRYFYNKDRLNNASKMYVHISYDKIDVIYISNGILKVANTYATPTNEDKLYYILAVAKASGFALDKDEIMLCGLPPLRDQLANELRKYASYVMPVIFPSALFSVGKEAFESPFELVILPLCE